MRCHSHAEKFIISNLIIHQAGTTISRAPVTNINENFYKTYITMFIGDIEEKFMQLVN